MKYNKVCVYAICKNEQLYIEKWLESLLEADYIVIYDTGSTDDTYTIIKKFANKYKDKIICEQQFLNSLNFSFSEARQHSLDMCPKDNNIICIQNDIDQFIEKGFRDKILKIANKYPNFKQINFLDKLLKNDSEYVYNIDINSNKCRPIDRDTPKRNLLYLLPAALLFIGVDLPIYLLRNKIRYSFKTTHIVFMFSALFWLVIFQVASISIFSLTHLVFDSYSIFFVFTIFVIATTFFAWFIKKTRKNYVIDYSYFKI